MILEKLVADRSLGEAGLASDSFQESSVCCFVHSLDPSNLKDLSFSGMTVKYLREGPRHVLTLMAVACEGGKEDSHSVPKEGEGMQVLCLSIT